MDLELLGEVVRGLLPTIGVSLLFGFAIWAIVRADATERAERARLEAAEDAAVAAEREAEALPGAGPAPTEVDTGRRAGEESATEDDARRT